MTRQRRRGPVPDASNLFRATPAIVLIVSTHAAGPARADDSDGPPAAPDDAPEGADAAGGGPPAHDPIAASGGEPVAAGRLVLPLDLDEASDSAFVRRLLLSHGIELDLGASGTLDRAAFVALVERLRTDGAGALVGADGAVLDVELVPDDAFDLTLALDVDEELSRFPRDGTGGWERRRFVLEGVVLPAPDAAEPEVAAAGPAPPATSAVAASAATVAGCTVPRELVDEFAATFDGTAPDAGDEALHARLHEALASFPKSARGARITSGASSAWRVRWLDCPVALPAPSSDHPATASGPPIEDEDAGATDAQALVPELPSSAAHPAPGGDDPSGLVLDVPEDVAGPDDSNDSDDPAEVSDPGDPDDSLFAISDDLPPGFEGLGGPVAQLVDVYLGDRRVGTTGITVTADEFEFDAVDEVVSMLDGLEDLAPLLPVLRGPMRTNAARRCYAVGDPAGCGTVETDTVAALYDESALRLDLFVAPSLLPVDGLGARYLDAPERRPSAILSLGTVASDADGAGEIDATGGLLVGYGATHLSVRADYTSRGNRSRLREARLARFAGDYEYALGSFGFAPGAGLLNADLLGASAATSWRLRTDAERAFAAELVVYLPRRAIVQLLVDDRIYHAESYPAGNQSIDTSALPDGTYELEIRTVDEGVETRTETRLYTKSASIPPPGQTVLALTAGLPLFFDDGAPDELIGDGFEEVLDAAPDAPPEDAAPGAGGSLGDDRFLPSIESVPVLGASAARRLTDRDAWRLGLLQVGDVTVAQAEYVRLGARYALELGGSAGGRGVLAAGARASVFAGGWSATLSHTSARADADLGDDPDAGTVFERFFPSDADQSFLSVARSFGSTQLGGRLSRRRGDGTETVEETSLFARRRLFRSRGLDGTVEADWTRTDTGSRAGIAVRVFFGRSAVRGSAYAGARSFEGGSVEPVAGVGVGTGSRAAGTLRWRTDARLDVDGDGRRLGVGAELEHPWFAAGASTDWTEERGDVSRTSLASLRAQVGIDARGAAIGGVEQTSAGVIVDVGGEPRGARFDIEIDGIDAGTGEIGSARFIALQPFRAYRVRLVPQGVLSNGIGERAHEFTLFPGSVQRIDVEARREVLLIATLVDERGAAIVDATFETARGPVLIDSSGVFQAELSPGKTFEVRRNGRAVCEFDSPEPPDDEPILIPERPLPCRAPTDPGAAQ